jgi:hypothetical protein
VRAFLIKKFLFAAIVMAWLFEKFSQILDDQVSEMIQQMCKTVAEMGGGGPDAREVYESLSIGFQVNRALRLENMMKSEGSARNEKEGSR